VPKKYTWPREPIDQQTKSPVSLGNEKAEIVAQTLALRETRIAWGLWTKKQSHKKHFAERPSFRTHQVWQFGTYQASCAINPPNAEKPSCKRHVVYHNASAARAVEAGKG